MRILVVGSGGREHALAWKLAQDHEVVCTPGNIGIAADVPCVGTGSPEEILALAPVFDLVVVGPEDPLIKGLADQIRAIGIPTYGPGADGARLEGSKAFSKEVMVAAGIRTAEHVSFTDASSALEYTRSRFEAGRGVAVKASGNALGKGVVVCTEYAQAQIAIHQMMVDRQFGDAGAEVVIEDRLEGPEFSLLTIVGDEGFFSLPIAQDYKRVFDGDQGPNTGGMGSYSPCSWASEDLVRESEQMVVQPLLEELRSRGIGYRGTLFSGLMVQDGVPYCLEYNVRFGDPETQSVMLRLGKGLGEALFAAATGLPIPPPEVLENASATVVIASGGYPGDYEKGLAIAIAPLPEGAKLFHAGTAPGESGPVTNGGRVIAASASAPTVALARAKAYAAAAAVKFEGAFYRKDIAS
jgi:phosphoribosylamine--glycine ligase